MKKKIVLIGGAEDKIGEKEILKKIVEINNNGIIGICTSALNKNPLDSFETYKKIFNQLGVEDIINFDIRTKEEADFSEHLQNLDLINTIFFTGGDQVRLKEIFENTYFFEKLQNKVENKTINYCGTSAGSMIVAETIIYDGDYKGLVKGAVKKTSGFGFVKNILIDTHFFKRLRLERISQILLSGIASKGIGIAEDSGIIINGTECEIIGKNCVTFINSSDIKTNIYKQLKENEKIPVIDIKITMLSNGDKFCLKNWKPIL